MGEGVGGRESSRREHLALGWSLPHGTAVSLKQKGRRKVSADGQRAQCVDMTSCVMPLHIALAPPPSIGLLKLSKTCQGFWGFLHGTGMPQAPRSLHHAASVVCAHSPGAPPPLPGHCLHSFMPPTPSNLLVVLLRSVPLDGGGMRPSVQGCLRAGTDEPTGGESGRNYWQATVLWRQAYPELNPTRGTYCVSWPPCMSVCPSVKRE